MMRAAVACLLLLGCRMDGKTMDVKKLVGGLRSDEIRCATFRPPGSQFATLERRVMVTAPDGAKRLAESGDPAVLDQLVPLLADPARAWAAEVILAAMTRNEEKMVDVYMRSPDEWWKVLGPTARDRWQKWLDERRGRLTWDPAEKWFRLAPAGPG